MLVIKTTPDTNQAAFFRLISLSSTKYDTGTSVDEMVEVRAAMDNKVKKLKETIKPTDPIEANKEGKI